MLGNPDMPKRRFYDVERPQEDPKNPSKDVFFASRSSRGLCFFISLDRCRLFQRKRSSREVAQEKRRESDESMSTSCGSEVGSKGHGEINGC